MSLRRSKSLEKPPKYRQEDLKIYTRNSCAFVLLKVGSWGTTFDENHSKCTSHYSMETSQLYVVKISALDESYMSVMEP